MAKSIYPGNYVNRLSSYQSQSVIALPGRVYYHRTGYALVGSTGATSFDVTIPSPDMRGDDKPRADVTSLVIPVGAKVYQLGIRVPDMRKDRGQGTAFSGLVGTNTNRIKLASAVNTTATGQIATTALGTDSSALAVSSTTIAPAQTQFGAITPVAITGSALTLKVYVTDNTGTSAGSNLSSTATGGTPLIVEVAYYLEDEVADVGDVRIPFIREN